MGYPRQLLNDGESIALELHPHWRMFVGPGSALAVALALGVVALTVELGGSAGIAQIGALVLVVVALVAMGVRFARWRTTNFVVTTDRLIYRAGILAKQGLEIPLERVNNIAFSQRIFERMLGSGDLTIESAGETGHQTFADIGHPSKVQNEIYRQMELAAERDAARMGSGRTLSVAEQLEKLAALRRDGALTQAEFDVQKGRLLGG